MVAGLAPLGSQFPGFLAVQSLYFPLSMWYFSIRAHFRHEVCARVISRVFLRQHLAGHPSTFESRCFVDTERFSSDTL